MTLDWVYPVNARSESWGYCHPDGQLATPGEVMANPDRFGKGAHQWHLPRRLKAFEVGHRVWVRESLPVAAFIGMGFVASSLEWRTPPGDVAGWYFDVQWDKELSRSMAGSPVKVEMDRRAQSPRQLTPRELRRLRAGVGHVGELPKTPAGKVRRSQEVVVRQGQQDFRARLMRAYDGRCAVTGVAVGQVLQAAHIEPYDGPISNGVTNGLLLRADIHNLFDFGLVWVTPAMRVALHDSLRDSKDYGNLHGRKLRLPREQTSRPDPRRLARHRQFIAGQSP